MHVVAEPFRIVLRHIDRFAQFAAQKSTTLAEPTQRLFDARGFSILFVFFVTAVQVKTHALDDSVNVGAEEVTPDAEPARKQEVESDNACQEDREHDHAARLVGVLQRL